MDTSYLALIQSNNLSNADDYINHSCIHLWLKTQLSIIQLYIKNVNETRETF